MRDGKYDQRRWQVGFDGKETNVDEKQVDFVVGSGNHSQTYLHLTSRNTLQVLPLSSYAEKGGYWDMSPGYGRLPALGRKGDAQGAMEQLTIAANGSDANVRAEMLDVLQRLGR